LHGETVKEEKHCCLSMETLLMFIGLLTATYVRQKHIKNN